MSYDKTITQLKMKYNLLNIKLVDRNNMQFVPRHLSPNRKHIEVFCEQFLFKKIEKIHFQIDFASGIHL